MMDNVKTGVQEDSEKKEEIKLRREARRRKILENSKSRLDRLNGRVLSGGDGNGNEGVSGRAPKVEPDYEFSDPEVEPDILPERVGLPQTQAQARNFTGEFNELFSALGGEVPVEQKKPFFLTSRVHILLSATIAYVLSLAGNMLLGPYAGNFSLFMPAGLALALELMFFRGQQPNRPFVNIFITICGFRMQEANRLLQFFSTIQSLVIDVGLIVFFYCSLTFLLTCLNEQFVDLVVVK